MKNYLQIIGICCLFLASLSCSSDKEDAEMVKFAVPQLKSLSELRGSVSITAARQTASEGKIYVAQDYLFYIAKEQGIHIFDNSNPAAPQNISYINIEGVHDIAVKGNYLYADNYVDLLVFDISDISNITLVQTIGEVLEYLPAFPEGVDFFDSSSGGEGQVIVGYKTELRPRPKYANDHLFEVNDGALAGSPTNGGSQSVGTGGSYAKFQINGDALYTTDSYKLNVFNISNPASATFSSSVSMTLWFGNGAFETLFKQGDYLFVGATNGMFVVDAHDPFHPEFISGFSHATACDPVVVSGNTAYITVRGGSSCGAIEDEITVIDISDINNPTLMSSFPVPQPRGLGIKDNVLYVATGDGFKIFDASQSSGLTLQNTYPENITDVIPLDSHLITVGPNIIRQYAYAPDYSLQLLSTVNF